MGQKLEYKPNEKAPISGIYELLNIFGSPHGKTAFVCQGERLPLAPRDYTWRQRVGLDGADGQEQTWPTGTL